MNPLVEAARTFLDVPFRHRGRSRRGVDCIGLLVVALEMVGRSVVDRLVYGRDPEEDKLRDALVAEFGAPIPKDQLQVGDIVLMKWHKRPQHVGLVTDYPLGGFALIHADIAAAPAPGRTKPGRVVEHRLADPWPRRIIEGFRP